MQHQYPYLPEGRTILYVSKNNPFILEAEKIAGKTGCVKQATGAVVVKDGKIIGRGCNAGKRVEICPRVERGSKTGEDYHFCKELCLQEGHGEVTSIKDAKQKGHDTTDADLYLYGHWWCCKNCWDTMIAAGINNVYLLEGATEKFRQ